MRALQLAVFLFLVAIVLIALFRHRSARRPRLTAPDELVKEPVCQTYVVRSRAVRPARAADVPYFCSQECARRWASESRG